MKSQRLLLAAVAIALATTAQAQVKVGSNPGTISTNAVLDVEGTSGSHTVVLQNGNMGVGTATPAYPFQLITNTNNDFVGTFDRYNSGGGWSVIGLRKGYGTAAAPAAVSAAGQNVGQIAFQSYNGSSFNTGASILAVATQAQTTAAGGTNLSLFTTPNGSVASANRMTVDQSGYVGIGTSSPTNLLHVVSADFGGYAGVKIEDNSGGNTSIFTITPGYYGATPYANNVTLDIPGTGAINFGDGIQAVADNAYDIGTAANRWRYVYAANGTIQTSDMRLKKNVAPLTYGLSQVKALRTIMFDWKDGSNKAKKIGFSAQQLQSLMPELVNVGDNPEHTLGVNYGELTPVLVNAVQELNTKVEALEKENASLKAQANDMASLRSELDAIKALVLKVSPAQRATSVTKR